MQDKDKNALIPEPESEAAEPTAEDSQKEFDIDLAVFAGKPAPADENIENYELSEEEEELWDAESKDDDPEALVFPDDYYTPAPRLPYKPINRILWPLITGLLLIVVALLLLKIIRSWGDFDKSIYYLIAMASFALISPAFIITGIRDLVNQKQDPALTVYRWQYLVMAIPWIGSLVYWLYVLTRFILMYYKLGLDMVLYYSINRIAFALLSFFVANIFITLFIDLKAKKSVF